MPSSVGRFQRADRILRTRDFSRVLRAGRRMASRAFVVVVARRSEEPAVGEQEERRKLGVTVGRRVGNAVARNRLKRRIREWFRTARAALPAGSDTVVIARRDARDLSGSEVAAALDELIERVASSRPLCAPGGAR